LPDLTTVGSVECRDIAQTRPGDDDVAEVEGANEAAQLLEPETTPLPG